MWKNVLSRYSFSYLPITTCVVSTLFSRTLCEPEDQPSYEYFTLNLSASSSKSLREFLNKHKITECSGDCVIIAKSHKKDDFHIYEPFYGERAAFRLKGFLRTDDGKIACTGRVSILSGELVDEDFVANIPLVNTTIEKAAREEELNKVADLPTRMKMVNPRFNSPWNGQLIFANMYGNSYPTVKASFSSLPFKNQLVLDGRLCSSRFLNDKGECTFDRSMIKADISQANDSSVSPNIEEEREGDDVNECPVCKFMKRGPCKKEFLAFDECLVNNKDEMVKECFGVTKAMMDCMKNYEYYDIMTVGMAPPIEFDDVNQQQS